MDSSATLTFWQLLALGLGPAIVAALVGILAPLATQHAQERANSRTRLVLKFEELVGAVYEHYHWLDRAKNVRIFGEPHEIGPSPMAKMVAISNAYFPQFEPEIRNLDLASSEHEYWIADSALKRLNKDDNFRDGYKESFQKYLKEHHKLLNRMRDFARDEIQ